MKIYLAQVDVNVELSKNIEESVPYQDYIKQSLLNTLSKKVFDSQDFKKCIKTRRINRENIGELPKDGGQISVQDHLRKVHTHDVEIFEMTIETSTLKEAVSKFAKNRPYTYEPLIVDEAHLQYLEDNFIMIKKHEV